MLFGRDIPLSCVYSPRFLNQLYLLGEEPGDTVADLSQM